MKQGDMSLKLSNVHLSDEGTYRCLIPELDTECTVQLAVGEWKYMLNMLLDFFFISWGEFLYAAHLHSL